MSEQKNRTAKSPRHRARELALQGADARQIEQRMSEEKTLGRYDTDLFATLLRGTLAQHEALEAALTPHLDRPMDELSPVEFAVLLLGTYELTAQPETPYRVIINEAVELAKAYGGTDGHKFVNGVLDKLAAQVRSVETAAK